MSEVSKKTRVYDPSIFDASMVDARHELESFPRDSMAEYANTWPASPAYPGVVCFIIYSLNYMQNTTIFHSDLRRHQRSYHFQLDKSVNIFISGPT